MAEDNLEKAAADSAREVSTCADPVFILTASRSGSTLLRFILDTHPDVACPPETMITGACASLMQSWDILENAGSGTHRPVDEQVQLPEVAMEVVRGIVDQLYGRYLARRGKPRWCDKSLDNLLNARLLADLYPQARFICLYRHCMDVIASGTEACPWGVSRYGFDSYVAQMPGNTVAAIGAYWIDCVQTMLAFEQQQPERCFRLRYEDLVTAPEHKTAELLAFLGAAPAPGITSACFATPHEGDGPGDEKIWFTTKVGTDAVGRGVQVPAAALPDPLRVAINQTLDALGYRPVGADWNSATGPVDPRLPLSIPRPPGSEHPNGLAEAHQDAPDAVAVVASMLDTRIRQRAEAEPDEPLRRWPALAGQMVRLVVSDEHRQAEVLWSFRPVLAATGPARLMSPGGPVPNGSTPDGPAMTMIAGSGTWRALLDGEANVIIEIRTGRLRCVNRRDARRVRSDEVHAIAWLLGLAQVPLVRRESGITTQS